MLTNCIGLRSRFSGPTRWSAGVLVAAGVGVPGSTTGGSGGRETSDEGMTTAEYAVGTVAACGFGTVLYRILTSDPVANLLSGLIEKALSLVFG